MKVILAKSITLPVPHLIITKNVLKTQLHVIIMTTMIKRMMMATKHLKINLINMTYLFLGFHAFLYIVNDGFV